MLFLEFLLKLCDLIGFKYSAAFDLRLLGAMARRLAFSYNVMAAPKRVVLPIEPIAEAPIVRSGLLQRKGKSKWKMMNVSLHSDAMLVISEDSSEAENKASSGKVREHDLTGYSVERASVKSRLHVLRLSHALNQEILLQVRDVLLCIFALSLF